MAPSEPRRSLSIRTSCPFTRAGAEVTFETDRGDVKPYWAKRYLQAVNRANKNDELFEFVERLLVVEAPSRGFLILKKAGRLDLTVEALVCDESKSNHDRFAEDVVESLARVSQSTGTRYRLVRRRLRSGERHA